MSAKNLEKILYRPSFLMALCLICEELYLGDLTQLKRKLVNGVWYLSSLRQQPLLLGVLFSPESSSVVDVLVHCIEADCHTTCKVLQIFAYVFVPDAWPVPLVL